MIEIKFHEYMHNLKDSLPDGIFEVNDDLLAKLSLVGDLRHRGIEPTLTRFFQVVESADKITLINENYIVWIVPDRLETVCLTYTLIARNHSSSSLLEAGFVTSGAFNSSWMVLHVLERFLDDIEENERLIRRLVSEP